MERTIGMIGLTILAYTSVRFAEIMNRSENVGLIRVLAAAGFIWNVICAIWLIFLR